MPAAVCSARYRGAFGWLIRQGSTGCHRAARTGSGSGITLLIQYIERGNDEGSQAFFPFLFCFFWLILTVCVCLGGKVWDGRAIIMNQFPPASENLFLSPFLRDHHDTSPYLSPFPNPYRRESIDLEDLIQFSLEQPQGITAVKVEMEVGVKVEVEEKGKRDEQVKMDEVEEEFSAEAGPINNAEAATWHASLKREPEVKEEELSPLFFARESLAYDSEITTMIQFLVDHSHLREETLQLQGRKMSQGNSTLLRAFKMLVGKFKRLRKTKEQMTKYCLRKAFKFIAASRNSQARDLDHVMRQYFEEAGGSFSIPFKKNSSEKTMNANFLKRIFACQQFAQDYRAFLEHFRPMVADDNAKKVRYLGQLIEVQMEKGDLQALSKVKRLPWTKPILGQVLELAAAMPQGSQVATSRQSQKRCSE